MPSRAPRRSAETPDVRHRAPGQLHHALWTETPFLLSVSGPLQLPSATPTCTRRTISPSSGVSTAKLRHPIPRRSTFRFRGKSPRLFWLEAAYGGGWGRHFLEQRDLAEPVDYVDPQGAGDYYAAGTQLSKLVDQNGGNYGLVQDSNGNNIGSAVNVPAIQYFENVFPFMAGVDYGGESATQAIYNNEWAPYRSQYGATTSLSDIDFYCGYGCPDGWQSHFWQDQFSSLYALSSIGMSYYNGMQLTLRHPTTHGLLF